MTDERKWLLGRKAMVGSLIVAHAWGTLLIISVLLGKTTSIIGDMFSTVGFMIFSTLGVLVGGKGWKDFAKTRWGKDDDSGNSSSSVEG